MENRIKVLKLITGEEIVTTLKPTDSGVFILNKPMTVTMTSPDDSGQMFLNLTSWSFAGDSERVSLEPKNVLAILDPTTVIINEYNTANMRP